MRRTTDPVQQPTTLFRASTSPVTTSDAEYLATLERRLADGYARIEDARVRGQDVTAWEAFWIDLLHQYELAVDGLPVAA